jgi:hypothetical protein
MDSQFSRRKVQHEVSQEAIPQMISRNTGTTLVRCDVSESITYSSASPVK